MQRKLAALGVGFLDTLPRAVQDRVRALQDLQAQHDELLQQFKAERTALEAKYTRLYAPIFSRRGEIITGKAGSKTELMGAATGEERGVPDFWSHAMRNHEALKDAITERDAEALSYLDDVRVGKLGGGDEGFFLTFHFSQNPFFSNKILQKTYVMVDEDESILDEARGTDIEWKKGMDLTTKVMKRKAKKACPSRKAQIKVEKVPSFFHFFSPPDVPEDEDELDEEEAEELQDAMEADFEMGLVFRYKIVPHAVDWFTGDAVDEEDWEDENDEPEDSTEAGKGEETTDVAQGFMAKGANSENTDPPECKQS
jgi:nucleosome assembly protein 1-like 1